MKNLMFLTVFFLFTSLGSAEEIILSVENNSTNTTTNVLAEKLLCENIFENMNFSNTKDYSFNTDGCFPNNLNQIREIQINGIPYLISEKQSTEKNVLSISESRDNMVVFEIPLSPQGDLGIQNHYDGTRQAACWGDVHSCEKENFEYTDPNIFRDQSKTPFSFYAAPNGGGVDAKINFENYFSENPKIKFATQSFQIPGSHELVGSNGANLDVVVVNSTGNLGDDSIFDTGTYVDDNGLWHMQDGTTVTSSLQIVYNNIIAAVKVNKAVFAAGYFVDGVNLEEWMKTPSEEHFNLIDPFTNEVADVKKHPGSTGCRLVEETCFYMPYAWAFYQTKSDGSTVVKTTFGTSFSSPSLGTILNSLNSEFPWIEETETVQLAKDCAIKLKDPDSPGNYLPGQGVPNYPCMVELARERHGSRVELKIQIASNNETTIATTTWGVETSTRTEYFLSPREYSNNTALYGFILEGVDGNKVFSANHGVISETQSVSTVTGVMRNEYTTLLLNPTTTSIQTVKAEIQQALANGEEYSYTQANAITVSSNINEPSNFTLVVISEDGSEHEYYNIVVTRKLPIKIKLKVLLQGAH